MYNKHMKHRILPLLVYFLNDLVVVQISFIFANLILPLTFANKLPDKIASDKNSSNSFLDFRKRSNSGFFEELTQNDNFERECLEEVCNQQEFDEATKGMTPDNKKFLNDLISNQCDLPGKGKNYCLGPGSKCVNSRKNFNCICTIEGTKLFYNRLCSKSQPFQINCENGEIVNEIMEEKNWCISPPDDFKESDCQKCACNATDGFREVRKDWPGYGEFTFCEDIELTTLEPVIIPSSTKSSETIATTNKKVTVTDKIETEKADEPGSEKDFFEQNYLAIVVTAAIMIILLVTCIICLRFC